MTAASNRRARKLAAPGAPPIGQPVGIVGLGLLGGSLAQAIRDRWPATPILAVETDRATRARALARGFVDDVTATPQPGFGVVRVVLLCVPYGRVESTSRALGKHLRPGTLVCDVVGVKAPVAAIVRRNLARARYIGTHPMAGGERRGLENSRRELFAGRPVALCPGPTVSPATLLAVKRFWAALGALPVVVSPGQHDRIVARTSHLPYLLGLCLLRIAAELPGSRRLLGGAFLDATRRVGFSPEVMAAAVAVNGFVPASLSRFADECRRLAALIRESPARLTEEAEEGRRLLAQIAGQPGTFA